ncbi:MAG: hydroxyethylthiazole kinase [Spirochaetaceae bacterium]|nr:hydroxyethylthiazole kinase [Spirochaetaceae bacterium]
MFDKFLSNLRNQNPLVHNITNYVTVNDVANILLAVGASPVMTDEAADVKQMSAISSAVNINVGTLNKRTIKSMFLAGKIANANGCVVVLDPVGAGATDLRTKTCLNLIKKVHFDVIKGNMSEIKTLASAVCKNSAESNNEVNQTKGVDVNENDVISENNLSANISLVKNLAKTTGSIIAVTGKIDLVSDGEKCYVIQNGHELMEKVCGTGCMISGLMGAFVAANADRKLEAAAACICAMGICGERAVKSLANGEGNITLRDKIIDGFMNIDDNVLQSEAKIELR